MRPARFFVLAVLILIFAFSTLLYAGVPQMINYQGKITTPAGALIDTTVQMIFTIYDDSTTGTALWADTQSTVVVEKGIFSVLLGSGNPIPDSLFDGNVRYLGTKVGSDPEMSPRQAIVSVAYAYKAEYSDTAEYAQVAVSDGDWTPDTSGINIYRLTGNVGIGTPTPGSKLELNGDGALQFAINNSSGRNWVMRSDNTGKFSLWDWSALNDACIVTSSGAPDAFTFEFKGNVGIGTPIPGSKLEINGDGALQFAINNTSGRNWVMRSDNTGKFSLWDFSALNDACIVTSSGAPDAFTFEFKGNVGIGTTSPGSYKLRVEGSSYGVRGDGSTYGVYGSGSYGVRGDGGTYGVYGTGSCGVRGDGGTYGVYGRSTSGRGVFGLSTHDNGVYGESYYGNGVDGRSTDDEAVYGRSVNDDGVAGRSDNGIGVTANGQTYNFYASGPGINYGPFTGGHEVKFSQDFPGIIKPGMVVSATGQAQVRKTDQGEISFSSTLPTVQLSDTPDDSRVLGVLISELPLDEDHWYINEVEPGDRFGTVNALGEGRVWVTNINGDIKAGDYITTSSIAGYGQKQKDDLLHSYTLGKAIEDIDWSTVTETVEFNGKTYRVYPMAVVYTSG